MKKGEKKNKKKRKANDVERRKRVEKREEGECAEKKERETRIDGRGTRERDVEEREALSSSLSVLDPVPISRLVIGADSRTQCYGLNGCEMRTKRFIVDERKCCKRTEGNY